MDNFFPSIVIGGGAAGFFGAIHCASAQHAKPVPLLEKTNTLLAKVRISGGGRCNVTHACFDPLLLSENYPRGGKALLGPFHSFQPKDTMDWFESKGVFLKTEEDGRVFPVTDSSETIIECLLKEAANASVEIRQKQNIARIDYEQNNFSIFLQNGDLIQCKKLLLATGSSKEGHALAASLGHTIIPPVPSLFTFNIPESHLLELAGITIDTVELSLENTQFVQRGPLLLTHWGFSGPAALKLSSWAARYLHSVHYESILYINWLPAYTKDKLINILLEQKQKTPHSSLFGDYPVPLARQLWKKIIENSAIDPQKKWKDIPNKQLISLGNYLQKDSYKIKGKTTYKQEFVTSGGVFIDEVNFKTMESKKCPGLYFAGEILDIDAVTGGFNFQNAWTTGFIAGLNMSL